MNINKNSNNEIRTITMDLENLQQKYSNLLLQYKQNVTDYINYLNLQVQRPCDKFRSDSKGVDQKCYDYIWKKSGCITQAPNANMDWAKQQTLNGLIYDSFLWATMTDYNHRKGCYGDSTLYSKETSPNYKINQPELVSIRGQSYIGTGSAGQSNANTLQDCIASCSQNSNCNGATFVSNRCELRTGDGQVVPSSNDSYAIIPKSKQMLLNMEDINQQLISINKQITDKIKLNEPKFYKNDSEGKKKQQELIDNYKILIGEREKIYELLNQYETLNSVKDEEDVRINKNYYTYILLIGLLLAILFIFYKISITNVSQTIQYGGELGKSTYVILFTLILIIIAINIFVKYVSI